MYLPVVTSSMAKHNFKVVKGDNMAYIYCIKNTINNKVYIGQTIRTVNQRFKQHINDARNNRCNSKLHRAITKYGEECFYPIILEECDEDIIDEREKYYIQLYDSVKNGYNISYGGEGRALVDLKQLEELYLQGKDFTTIANITGHTINTVSERLRGAGYKTRTKPHNLDKGKSIEFQGKCFSSITTLAKYLQANVEEFKDKEIPTIIKGISKNSKRGTKYCGYYFHRL